MEAKLLSALIHSRAAYDELRDTLLEDDFSDYGQKILKGIIGYYSADSEAAYVDKDILEQRLIREYPRSEDSIKQIVSGLTDVSIPNVLNEYVDLRLSRLSNELATALLDHKEADELVEEYMFLKERRSSALIDGDAADYVYETPALDALLKVYSPENLVQIYPGILNKYVGGGLPKGSHIVVFARPETGKSLFSINLAARMANDGRKVLYIGNEDQPEVMLLRMVSRLSDTSIFSIREDHEVAERAYGIAMDNGFDNIVFAELHPGTVADVRKLVIKYQPEVLVVDQIRNLTPSSKSLTRTEAYEYIAQSIRNISKEFNLLGISITQAGDSADQKLELQQGDVDNSNTGIPSTADVMVGIGVNSAYERIGKRCISLCKNKPGGTHKSFFVNILPHLSAMESDWSTDE